MKKGRFVLLIALLLAGTVFLTAFSEATTGDDEISDVKYNFTYISGTYNDDYWAVIAKGAVDADQTFLTNTRCIAITQLTSETKAEQIRKAVYSKSDGVIISGNGKTEDFYQTIQDTISADVPVVLVDTDIADSGRNCYIGTDNYEAGKMAGEDMIAATGGKGIIAVIVSSNDLQSERGRLAGFRAAVSAYPQMEIRTVLEGSKNVQESKEMLFDALNKYPDITGLFCGESVSSAYAGEALASEQYRNIKIVAFDLTKDTLQFIRNGRYYSVIAQDPYQIGYEAVKYLSEYQNGEKNLPDVIYTKTYHIDQNNVDKYPLNQSEGVVWNVY